ncbi:MAG TPA: Wzz/FepE/Etk N-terminal domain-containing protein [Acidimicrobiales bacterium]|nr:Wzz/FepE/Etk N-terminal domain-containing protein [Acidimicrobiales bacterium]
MELRQYLSVLRSRLWLVVVATVLAAGTGFLLSSSTSTYVARSTIYVGSQNVAETTDELTTDRIAALSSYTLTFSKMIDSEPIAAQALRDLDLDLSAKDVVRDTEVKLEPGTQLLYIDVSSEDAGTAQALSNSLADAFVEAVQEFEPSAVDSEGTVPRLPAYVFERAQVPTVPEPNGQIRTVLLATLFGLVGGAALAFLLDYLDVSLRSAADVERRLELPVLGVIPALGSEAPFGGRGPRQERPGDAR